LIPKEKERNFCCSYSTTKKIAIEEDIPRFSKISNKTDVHFISVENEENVHI